MHKNVFHKKNVTNTWCFSCREANFYNKYTGYTLLNHYKLPPKNEKLTDITMYEVQGKTSVTNK